MDSLQRSRWLRPGGHRDARCLQAIRPAAARRADHGRVLTCASYARLRRRGGRVVGSDPAGHAGLLRAGAGMERNHALLPAAFVIALISFMEAMSSCKVIAIKTRTRWDENQELIGQGLAKIAAAFCHRCRSAARFPARRSTWPPTPDRTLVAFRAGFVLLTLLFFTPFSSSAQAGAGRDDHPGGRQPDRPRRRFACLAREPGRRHRREVDLPRHTGVRAQHPERHPDRHHLLAGRVLYRPHAAPMLPS